MSLKRKALHALKWSVLGEVFSKAISPLVLVILAKILLPEDFGIVAAATVVISFSQVFWDAGLAKALIQRKERIEESATIVFWINVALGSVFFMLLVFMADYIALFFNDPRIGNVVRVLGIQLPLAAICSAHSALLQRDFQFRRLFWIRIFTTASPVLASIPLALYGAGYWALVAGTLLGQLAQTITLWNISSWRPTLWFDKDLAHELFLFGRWVMLTAFMAWFFLWMDAIIVGGFLGTHDLGLYRTGNALVSLIFGVVAGPVIPVLYSLFSKIGDDIPKLKDLVLLLERLLMITVLPIGIGLLILQDIIPVLVFTEQWGGVGEIVGVIGITQAISYTVSVRQEVYRSIGRPAVESQIMFVSMLIRLPFYLVSVHFGIIAFVWARFASTILGVMNHLYFARKIIQLPYIVYFKPLATTLFAGGVMFLAGRFCLLILGVETNLILRTLIVIIVCAFIYGVFIYSFESSSIRKAVVVLRGQDSPMNKEDSDQ